MHKFAWRRAHASDRTCWPRRWARRRTDLRMPQVRVRRQRLLDLFTQNVTWGGRAFWLPRDAQELGIINAEKAAQRSTGHVQIASPGRQALLLDVDSSHRYPTWASCDRSCERD